jgi:hypothetical protein
MSGPLSPRARAKLADLALLVEKAHRVHGLVEQLAASRGVGADHLVSAIVRNFGQLRLDFMGAGMDALSQLAGAMQIAARRGLSTESKIRILREGVGSIRFQLELAQRAIISDDRAAQQKEAAERDAGADGVTG